MAGARTVQDSEFYRHPWGIIVAPWTAGEVKLDPAERWIEV